MESKILDINNLTTLELRKALEKEGYISNEEMVITIFLALKLGKPVLVEGAPGVGKTEIGKVLSRAFNTDLIRLQCYEGLDETKALYEWNYQRQLLKIQILKEAGMVADACIAGSQAVEKDLFTEEYLLERPLLKAIRAPKKVVLLIDEVDKCIPADTFISTPSGLKRAKEIKVGDSVYSFEPSFFKRSLSYVKKINCYHVDEIIRVYIGGKILEVTPEHKIICYNEQGYSLVKASQLQKGDCLVIDNYINSNTPEEPDLELADSIIKINADGKKFLHERYQKSKMTYLELSKSIGISRNHLRNILQPISFRDSLRFKVLKKLCKILNINLLDFINKYTCGLVLNDNLAFYELLGYIVADGCFTSNRLYIADKDINNLKIYADKFEEAFGQFPRIEKGPHKNYVLIYHSEPLGRFLKKVLGDGLARSRLRTLPGFFYQLPEQKISAFLRGYFDGEGSIGSHFVTCCSSSKNLIVDIQSLLQTIGISSFIYRLKGSGFSCKGKNIFQLMIYEIDKFKSKVGFNSAKKALALGKLRSRKYKKAYLLPKDLIIPKLKKIAVNETLHLIPHHQTIYDLISGRIKTNADSIKRIEGYFPNYPLKEYLDENLFLGTVTHIEKIKNTSFDVFDFVLEGRSYFVANGVVVHNCDEEFEAFLFEILSDFQVSIPEMGTLTARHIPIVVLTSNAERELSDGLKRRCIYLYLDYPSIEKEIRILQVKVPEAGEQLARQVARAVSFIRNNFELKKKPAIAETLDWARALVALNANYLEPSMVSQTLNLVLKNRDDIEALKQQVGVEGIVNYVHGK